MWNRALLAALVSAAFFPAATSFTSSRPLQSRVGSGGSDKTVLNLTPEEERAALLSDYLARSHEEKLKAVRAIEEKKDAEINSLKEQFRQSQAAAPPATAESKPVASTAVVEAPAVGHNVEALSKDELVNVVKSYQQFMAKYVVEAQEQKTNAVKAAEAAVAQKYEARLQQLAGKSGESFTPAPTSEPVAPSPKPVEAASPEVASAPAPVPAPAPAQPVEELEIPSASAPAPGSGNLYAQRNARVVAAAAAGKSRWGNLEVDRAVFLTERANGVEQANGATSSEKSRQIPPEVEAADHGLRNDGGVGGLTLAERVAMGAEAGSAKTVNGAADATSEAPPSVPAEILVNEKLFQQRNVRVAAAAKAGKSRWGEMEVMRIQNSIASVSESRKADIAAADHGLQPEQGPSLSDRVNLGARLLGK